MAASVVQILALVLLGVLVFWLIRRARLRSEARYEQLAPAPPSATAPGPPPEEAELREIYSRLGKPDAFVEAREKVVELAARLVEQDGLEMDVALRTAYRRSLAEHRDYLASKGLA